MKKVHILLLLALVSCGKTEVYNDNVLGTMRSVNPLKLGPSTPEYQRLQEVCEALKVKSRTISALVNNTYSFAQTRKNCTDSSFSEQPEALVTLSSQTNGLKFMEGPNYFYFSEVETDTTGTLVSICNKLSDLTSPIVDGVNLLYVTAFNSDSNDCPMANDEVCVRFERAIRKDTKEGPKGQVHTREWIRFRLEQPNLGFFTYRKMISEAACEKGQLIGRTATLK